MPHDESLSFASDCGWKIMETRNRKAQKNKKVYLYLDLSTLQFYLDLSACASEESYKHLET